MQAPGNPPPAEEDLQLQLAKLTMKAIMHTGWTTLHETA